MLLFRSLLLLALAAAIGGCSNRHHAAGVDGPYAWGEAGNVRRYAHLYFAGQPDAAGLEAAKQAGVSVVINLRQPGEHDWDEAAAAEAAGLRYYSVPVNGAAPLARADMERIEAIVHEHEDADVLIHCASGNRAAAWLAIHLVERHGMETDEALALGRDAGITRGAWVAKVRDYLGG